MKALLLGFVLAGILASAATFGFELWQINSTLYPSNPYVHLEDTTVPHSM